MPDTTFIYALCEPGTRIVRYIGKSDNPKKRLGAHVRVSSEFTRHLGRWLKRLARSKQVPNLVILAEVPRRSWESEERRYIAAARMLGMDLVNSTDGGEGVTMTPETRKKIGISSGKARSGGRLTEAHRRAIGQGVLGTRHGLETRRKVREANIGEKNFHFGKFGPAHSSFGSKRKTSTSKFRGVCWHKIARKWVASIKVKGKLIHIGLFTDEADAARAWDAAAIKLYGLSVKTNFPLTPTEIQTILNHE